MGTCTLTIDGRKVTVPDGTTILNAARENGIRIPSLCSHEALSSYTACRLCVVEVGLKSERRIVTSCSTPVSEGMTVRTNSNRIVSIRKTLVALLLARSPRALPVQKLARETGVYATPYRTRDELCILCGMCVRTCHEIVGAGALSFVFRGGRREVTVPFFRDSRECVGCGSCVFVCPTGYAAMDDTADDSCNAAERIMETWRTRLEMRSCSVHGRPFAPERMLEYIARHCETSEEFNTACPQCRHHNPKQT